MQCRILCKLYHSYTHTNRCDNVNSLENSNCSCKIHCNRCTLSEYIQFICFVKGANTVYFHRQCMHIVKCQNKKQKTKKTKKNKNNSQTLLRCKDKYFSNRFYICSSMSTRNCCRSLFVELGIKGLLNVKL